MTSNLPAALSYAARGLPDFPVIKTRDGRKVPAVEHGYLDATTDTATITGWWTRNPGALVAMPTGRLTGVVVLDIDVKNGVHGWDALENLLGALPLADTPHAHTPTGGCHVHFKAPDFEVRCSAGRIGPGLDIRGDGGSIILPAPVGGYWWDPHFDLDKVPLAPMPEWLIEATRPKVERIEVKAPDYVMPGLSRYGRGSLDGAGRDIINAPAGAQESTLNGRAFWIGQLVGGGEIPLALARDALIYAASKMPNYDPRRAWQLQDITKKITAGLDAGMKKPFTPEKERKRG